MGTVQSNKQLVHDFSFRVKDIGLLSGDDLAAAKQYMDDLFVDDYVDHDPFPAQPPGRDGLWQAIRWFCAAFPDQHLNVTHLMAEGELVMLRGAINATNKGSLMGIPPTNKRVSYVGDRLFRLRDGKFIEGWFNFDGVGLMQQLGVVPIPPGTDPFAPAPVPPVVTGGIQTSVDENKELMRRLIDDLWNRGNLSVTKEIFHPEATSPSAPMLPKGPDGVNFIVNAFRSAFPDYWIKITDLVAEGDQVAARLLQGGTHQGNLMGIPATGKTAEWSEMAILRIAGGQVVESWYEGDALGMMRQLGVGG